MYRGKPMNIEDIYASWEVDSKINEARLPQEALKTTELHNKYEKIYTAERLVLIKLDSSIKELKSQKWEFYVNGHTTETKKKGWIHPNTRLSTSEIKEIYLPGDKDLIAANELFQLQKAKVELLESILKIIHSRNYIIDTSAKHTRFLQGDR
jgi:hypothetical protein